MLDAKWAMNYFRKLNNEAGASASSNGNTNEKLDKKYALFEKSYTSHTDKISFVEAPLFYNKRPTFIIRNEVSSLSALEISKRLNGSLARIIIFKDNKTGKLDQQMFTYIPDSAYLKKHHNDISHLYLHILDRDYNGFILYRNWSEKLLNALKRKNVKGVKRLAAVSIPKEKDTTEIVKIMRTCEPIYIFLYQQQCWCSDPEHRQCLLYMVKRLQE